MIKWHWIFGAIAFFVLQSAAFAAQDSTVIDDNAPIRLEPKSSAKILEYLPVGTEIRVSSFPMQGGWYKVRSKTGVYGWINEKYLSVYKPPKSAKDIAHPSDLLPKPERDRKWFLRILGGFDFFRPDDINKIFDFQDLNTGYNLGGEAGLFISERVALAFRAEAIVKDLVAKENQSSLFFNLALRSYPVMGGMDFYFWKLPAVRVSVGVFGGVALATSFSSEATALGLPNVMVLQRSPFTSYLRVNVTRPLGRIISVFLEGGYRFLKTEEIDTTSASGIRGGPELYAKDGTFRSRVIDLSGLVLAVGAGVHF